MAGEEVTILRLCGKCNAELGTFLAKKENMMLVSKELVWCPRCQDKTPEVRDIAGRRAAIEQEAKTYPRNV
ncbi:MAG: hypothetical protein HYY31_06420 [Chloroflexi bacterium]|nr:hypothetical protein [Chloroflexota bacterium]